ncbi:MAG: biopolymer transport protein ExbB/TolQ [Paraglaciecola sp.]|jgi:biopolymer transport protein ExbB/TolQ
MKTTLVIATVASLLSTPVLANSLFSLENLERERAALLSAQFDSSLDLDQRQQKVQNIYRRLVDIERMVLRDDRVTSSNSQLAQNAFDKYELTFLVHSSAEKNQPPLSHWMSEVHLTTDNILSAKSGHR